MGGALGAHLLVDAEAEVGDFSLEAADITMTLEGAPDWEEAEDVVQPVELVLGRPGDRPSLTLVLSVGFVRGPDDPGDLKDPSGPHVLGETRTNQGNNSLVVVGSEAPTGSDRNGGGGGRHGSPRGTSRSVPLPRRGWGHTVIDHNRNWTLFLDFRFLLMSSVSSALVYVTVAAIRAHLVVALLQVPVSAGVAAGVGLSLPSSRLAHEDGGGGGCGGGGGPGGVPSGLPLLLVLLLLLQLLELQTVLLGYGGPVPGDVCRLGMDRGLTHGVGEVRRRKATR